MGINRRSVPFLQLSVSAILHFLSICFPFFQFIFAFCPTCGMAAAVAAAAAGGRQSHGHDGLKKIGSFACFGHFWRDVGRCLGSLGGGFRG